MELDIKKPVSKAEKCHQDVLEELKKSVIIQEGKSGQIVLTVLIATRAEDDIEKAMKDANIPSKL